MKTKSLYSLLILAAIFFNISCKKDATAPVPLTPPSIIANSPVNNAVNVAVNTTIIVTFTGVMNPESINICTFTLMQGTVSVAGVITTSGNKAFFTPEIDLSANKVYTCTITTGAKDLVGTAIANNYSFSFTTGSSDNLLPVVNNSTPINGAVNIAVNNPIRVTFILPIDPATISTSTFTLMQGTTAVAGAVMYNGSTATFTPSSNLEPNKVYTGSITTGVKNLSGNALATPYVFTFTTANGPDITRPTSSSVDPLANATGIVRNKVITITFSETMDPLTFNNSTFTVMQGSNAVLGTVEYSGLKATFTPLSNLTGSTTYTATITTGAKDLAGNALASNFVWSFTTGATIANLAVVNLGTAGNFVILAKTAITNIPTSAVTGDIGLSPAATSYITGFALTNATGYATASQITGKIYAADMASPTPINMTTAVNNMVTAYNDAAGRPTPDYTELGTGNIGGKTLLSGLYKWSGNVIMPANLTLSGDANDVWIFQIAGNLTMSSAVRITLTGGAQAKNIFWQVAGRASMGTNAHFEGVILSMTSITFQSGASLNGRALAQTAVILDKNVITNP